MQGDQKFEYGILTNLLWVKISKKSETVEYALGKEWT